MIFKKDEWAVKEQMGEKVWQSLLGFSISFQFPLLWWESAFPGWWNIQGEDLWPLNSFGGSVIRQIRGIQRNHLPIFPVFQVSSAQNNQHAKVAYIGMAYSGYLLPS